MRIDHKHDDVVTGGAVLEEGNFKASGNAMIFHILSSGVYTNEIRAVIREVCTNALDGHINKGNQDRPFKVTMPTEIDPHFRVRDYGCSMDHKTVMEVFADYGKSTKNQSDDEVGGFGIGAKAPFAYSHTFHIKAFKDGVLRIYENSYENGHPKISLCVEKETTEEDGIEISVGVKRQDIASFRKEAQISLSAFEVKPEMNIDLDFFELTPYENIDGVLYTNNTLIRSHGGGQIFVRAGCVIYPIRDNDEISSYIYDSGIINYLGSPYHNQISIVLDINVSDIDYAPSREDLKYKPRTIKTIKSSIDKISSFFRSMKAQILWETRHLYFLDFQNKMKNHNEGIPKKMIEEVYKQQKVFGINGKLVELDTVKNREISGTLSEFLSYEVEEVKTSPDTKKEEIVVREKTHSYRKFFSIVSKKCWDEFVTPSVDHHTFPRSLEEPITFYYGEKAFNKSAKEHYDDLDKTSGNVFIYKDRDVEPLLKKIYGDWVRFEDLPKPKNIRKPRKTTTEIVLIPPERYESHHVFDVDNTKANGLDEIASHTKDELCEIEPKMVTVSKEQYNISCAQKRIFLALRNDGLLDGGSTVLLILPKKLYKYSLNDDRFISLDDFVGDVIDTYEYDKAIPLDTLDNVISDTCWLMYQTNELLRGIIHDEELTKRLCPVVEKYCTRGTDFSENLQMRAVIRSLCSSGSNHGWDEFTTKVKRKFGPVLKEIEERKTMLSHKLLNIAKNLKKLRPMIGLLSANYLLNCNPEEREIVVDYIFSSKSNLNKQPK